MKKILSCFVVLFAAVSLYATELNIYASGLKVHQTASGATIDYMLNAPATTLNVYIYGPANTVTPVKTIDLSTDAANLTKGAHAGVAIDLTGLPDAVYTWAIEAGAAARANDEKINISEVAVGTASRGLAIDDNPESPYFGTMYYTVPGGAKKLCKASADFSVVEDIVTNFSTWGTGASSPLRISIGEDGLLYVTDWSDATPNVVIVDRKDNSATAVFGGTKTGSTGIYVDDQGREIHGSMPGCVALGTGESRVLYTYDEDMLTAGKKCIYAYNIGTLESPWASAPSAVEFANTTGVVANGNANLAADGHGGWWITQHRWNDDANHALVHVNNSGEIDYTSTTGLLTADGYNTRAALFVNHDKTLYVTSTDGAIKIWRPTFEASSVQSVELVKTITSTGLTNNYNVIMDPAGNLYQFGANNMVAFATAKAENKFTTPAPSAEYISLPCVEHLYEIGDNQGWALNAGVEMTKIATNVFQGEFTFANATSYFTLSAALGTNADDWATVNASRYGADNGNEPIANGDVKALHLGWGNSFAIPAGKYRITADLNDLTVTVKQLWDNIYGYTDASGSWVLDGLELTKKAENVFEGEFVLPEASHILFAKADADNWGDINNAQIEINTSNDYWVNGNSEATIIAAPLTPGQHPGFLIKAGGKYKFNVNLNTNKIVITQMNAMIEVTDAGYATYYNGVAAYEMPTGMTGYVFNVANRLEQVYDAGDIVPAATPLVLGAAEGTYDLVFTTGGVAPAANSLLVGSDGAVMTNTLVSGEHIYYGLSLNSAGEASSVGFYWMEPNGAAFENGAHKAFLAVPVLTYQEEFLAPAIRFEENNATNIENVEGQEKAVKFIENGQIFIRKDGVVYDAMGRVIR